MVKREFIVERQGRSFVLYAGLLDLAHSQGLRAVRTRLLQIPADDNGLTAIVSAEVETDRGTFSGIGDANPANVTRAMLSCTIRLAETRAKARALRDAVNVGVTALEELGEQDELAPVAATENRPPTWTTLASAAGAPVDDAARAAAPAQTLATPAQVRAIYSIGRDQHSLAESEVDEKATSAYGLTPSELTKKQASDFITSLKGSR
ncbi:MAG TPA: hypothetical protein VKT80_04760 [Chloroflexota bacterium]|nr:hypothetical protein [Chloroflexota bacterium]